VRYKILAGVAAAVAYLHEDWQQCVLHRDIKASNVMLDADFNAHLGDFGLARLIDHQKVEKTTVAAGTLGYMAPEMPYTGKATKETDVYSFGVLVLEVVCGRRAIDTWQTEPQDLMLVDSVWRALEAGNLLSIVDPCFLHRHSPDCTKISGIDSNSTDTESSLHDSTTGDGRLSVMPAMPSEQGESMGDMLRLGLLCSHPIPSARPAMRIVNRVFQSGDMAILPPLPAKKPMLMEFATQAMSLHQEIISPHTLSTSVSNVTGSTSSS
jgi:interleukin-1 receptor-associated kinase 1